MAASVDPITLEVVGNALMAASEEVAASLRGVDSHGLHILPAYIRQIRAGNMDVTINMPVNDMAALALEYALKLVKGEKIKPGKITKKGAPWSPSEIKQGEKGLDFYLSSWPVDKKTVDDPTLWGNIFMYE